MSQSSTVQLSRIARAASLVMVLFVASRLLGLLREISAVNKKFRSAKNEIALLLTQERQKGKSTV